ncbi:MAG: flagellar biosynthesis anti-sigma factor FlgM [Gammaproteobacteria bacterium (ex Lamellibrachia satsuma)]|nr:MAG: flagellar biosynthesis anti-sigma factor FlgM [Gammaproteobacteria bacterium (ex Lamellibrachia satsuma)]RRS32959.1 MAG: flagellar biosynthesis anti-sigma factor FlgM [Gammaproteobacteria bacterium (ex Lamellibrachia satsuma)]RRS33378.1 MAG: flagellar biosynthesis anti-sigma factor FlgM [Gammaproteobacteria bacterium (ex Lamellibrachia satsuma)]
MAIEINSLSRGALQNAVESTSANQTSASSTGGIRSAATSQDDSVSLTRSATQLQSLEQKISQMPVVDAQQVESVQRAMATGSFNIDPEKSAENLLFMERALP